MTLTVVKKISLGFFLIGALLLITSVMSFFGLNDIRKTARDVVDIKMPILQEMVAIKTDILSLSVITANGYHLSDSGQLSKNMTIFNRQAEEFKSRINTLSSKIENESLLKAREHALNYITFAEQMYADTAQELQARDAIHQQYQQALSIGDQASAFMLDLSYLEIDDSEMDRIIGIGNGIDNKMFDLGNTSKELKESLSEQNASALIENIEYSISNIDVDYEYLQTLTKNIDTQDVMTSFDALYTELKQLYLSPEGLFHFINKNVNSTNHQNSIIKKRKNNLNMQSLPSKMYLPMSTRRH